MKILIPSVGGMGVGVLVEWLSVAAILEGLKPSVLNLPGVSQRTGRTLSYIEIRENDDNKPFSPFPEKGGLDIIISQDFLELIRILKEGYGGRGCNIIGTTYRYYTTHEKLSLKRDFYTYEYFKGVIVENSKEHIVVDIHKMGIQDFRNAHLLGILCYSGYLPSIRRESYERAIRHVGIDVEGNLRDFGVGYELLNGDRGITDGKMIESELDSLAEGFIKESIKRLESVYGNRLKEILIEAVRQLTGYQDTKYSEFYIRRVLDLNLYIRETVGETNEYNELMEEFAKVLVVRMMYEDVIRVAERKVSEERFKRIERLYRINKNEVFWVKDFFRPDLDELYGILPYSIGKMIDRILSRHKFSWKTTINTTHIFGFLMLKSMSKIRFLRKWSFRYRKENNLIENYIDHVKQCLKQGLDSAILAAKGGTIVRGYGEIRREMINAWREFSNLTNPLTMSTYIDNFFSEKRFENQKKIKMKSI